MDNKAERMRRFMAGGAIIVTASFLSQLKAPIWLWILTVGLFLGAFPFLPWIERTARRERAFWIGFVLYICLAIGTALLMNNRAQPRLLVTYDGRSLEGAVVNVVQADGHFRLGSARIVNTGESVTADGLYIVLYFNESVYFFTPPGAQFSQGIRPLWVVAPSAEEGYAVTFSYGGNTLSPHAPVITQEFWGHLPEGRREARVQLRIAYGGAEPYRAVFTIR